MGIIHNLKLQLEDIPARAGTADALGLHTRSPAPLDIAGEVTQISSVVKQRS